MALAAPNTAAHPPMSNFINSIMLPAPAFRLYPPLHSEEKKRTEKTGSVRQVVIKGNILKYTLESKHYLSKVSPLPTNATFTVSAEGWLGR